MSCCKVLDMSSLAYRLKMCGKHLAQNRASHRSIHATAKALAIEADKAGYPVQDIADALGVTRATIYTWLSEKS